MKRRKRGWSEMIWWEMEDMVGDGETEKMVLV